MYKQTQNGKANAVLGALEYTNNDVIAIIDSDISVEPFELKNFCKIIDLGNADFVNGSKLISMVGIWFNEVSKYSRKQFSIYYKLDNFTKYFR